MREAGIVSRHTMAQKQISPPLLVGIFLLVGLGILGWMILTYGATNKVKAGYALSVEFADASGIIEGGIVRLAGANVGTVSAPPSLTQSNTVLVPIMIRQDLKLPRNTKFQIISLSLLGDKAIYLKIPSHPSPELLQGGDTVTGKSPKNLDAVQSTAEQFLLRTNEAMEVYIEVAKQLHTSIERLNTTLLEREKLLEISETIKNISEASRALKDFSNQLAPFPDKTIATLKSINDTAQKAQITLTDFNAAVRNINMKVDYLDPTLKAIPKTLETYKEVGEVLKKSLDNEGSLLSTLTQDSDVQGDVKHFLKNLRSNGVLGYKDDSTPDEDPRDRYRGIRR